MAQRIALGANAMEKFDNYLNVGQLYGNITAAHPDKENKAIGDLITDGESSETQRVQDHGIFKEMESTLRASIRIIQSELDSEYKTVCFEPSSAVDLNDRDISVEKISVVNQKEASVSPISGYNQISK